MAAYSKTNWSVGNPISQEKMNKIEQGIYDAQDTADSNSRSISNMNDTITNLQGDVRDAADAASLAQSTANTAKQDAKQGQDAWTQILGVITVDQETGEITKNLATRIGEDESNIQSASQNITLLNNEITAARGQLIHAGNSASASNLKAKLDDMDTQISLNKGHILFYE